MSLLNRPSVKLIQLGRMRYLPALKVQESMVNRLQAGEDNHFLILVEHDPGKQGPKNRNQINLIS